MVYLILFESASGYALFQRIESEEIGLLNSQKSITDYGLFSKCVSLKTFIPFTSAEEALENINDISEGILNDYLKNFLEANTSKKTVLGVSSQKLGSSIHAELKIKCEKTANITELTRGIRDHFHTFIKNLSGDSIQSFDLITAQRGLAHSYSRAKVKHNVNRSDNMITQSICLLDQLEKDINTFSMRVKEWYSWHFPELVRIVPDNTLYAKCVSLIKSRSDINDETLPQLEEILQDASKAEQIIASSKTSMGTDVNEIDMMSIHLFAQKVVSLTEYKNKLQKYLFEKMHTVAPSLSALIGETVGARLISHAGSLINLAKYPASTVQILGAEKALFRALKTRGNTPKYGLIFNSSFISKAKSKDKGRISRCLANKCSMAARIDSFSSEPNSLYGEELKKQIEERLAFFDSGKIPRKNLQVMERVINTISEQKDENKDSDEPKKVKKTKKSKNQMELD